MPEPPVVGRFAPTPSGNLHLGNVFNMLLCWLGAKSRGGRILLRIEDLDLSRTSPAFTRQIIDDLLWLGLTWDEGPGAGGPQGPYLQSRRDGFYLEQLAKLAQKGLLYPCFCSRAQLHAASAPHAADGSYVYGGHCRGLTLEQVSKMQKQRPGAVRVQVPDVEVSFTDGLQGPYTENLQSEAGDFILRRSDGVFAYQLAAPADDGAMGVTQVVRGRDLLASTARQIWLIQTLGYAPPAYLHHPLLLAPDGRRLAKRDADMDLAALRKAHKGPETLLGALGHLAGLLPKPQPVSAKELLPLFAWQKLPKEDIPLPPEIWNLLL